MKHPVGESVGLITLIIILLPMIVAADSVTPIDVWIDADAYYSYSFFVKEGARFNGTFATDPGHLMSFYILDSANYQLYVNFGNWTADFKLRIVSNGTFDFVTPREDVWYILMRNHEAVSIHVTGQICLYLPVVTTSTTTTSATQSTTTSSTTTTPQSLEIPFGLLFPLAIVAGIVLAGGVFFTRSHRPTVLIVCPFCGAKTEQGRLKCEKCGADL